MILIIITITIRALFLYLFVVIVVLALVIVVLPLKCSLPFQYGGSKHFQTKEDTTNLYTVLTIEMCRSASS